MNFNSVSGKNWVFKKYNTLDAEKYSKDYLLNDIVAKLLSIRKKNIDNVDLFLNPTIKNLLPNPNILKDMDRATARAFDCIKNDEMVGIFGDYDVDGATSTALLKLYFSTIKQKVSTFIYFSPFVASLSWSLSNLMEKIENNFFKTGFGFLLCGVFKKK